MAALRVARSASPDWPDRIFRAHCTSMPSMWEVCCFVSTAQARPNTSRERRRPAITFTAGFPIRCRRSLSLPQRCHRGFRCLQGPRSRGQCRRRRPGTNAGRSRSRHRLATSEGSLRKPPQGPAAGLLQCRRHTEWRHRGSHPRRAPGETRAVPRRCRSEEMNTILHSSRPRLEQPEGTMRTPPRRGWWGSPSIAP